MADMLATPEELAFLMQKLIINEDTATLLLELSTGEVQSVTGQRLVLVEDDEIQLIGTTDRWLVIPERPVTEVTSITIDGGDELVEGTDFKRFDSRLSRSCGWAPCWTEPSEVLITCSHGWDVGAQELQPARAAALFLSREGYTNPKGIQSESIDDYRVQFMASIAAAMAANPYLVTSLRRRYRRRAGLVRIG